MKTFATLLQVALFAVLLFSPASAQMVPERLEYEATWSGIKAGSAVLEVVEHGDGHRILNTIASSGMVSSFFVIDDRIESEVSRSGRPVFFRKNLKEGRYRAHREITFDFKALNAQVRDLQKKSIKNDPITLETHDTLSSIYYIRYSDLEPGRTILFHIHDAKRLWQAEAKVVRRQKLTTRAGTFNTIMVTSKLSRGQETSRIGSATFWFTDDTRRIPVKVATNVKVGEITLTLAGISP